MIFSVVRGKVTYSMTFGECDFVIVVVPRDS
jgi:hypothetical protein